jgi:hypothetical protein
MLSSEFPPLRNNLWKGIEDRIVSQKTNNSDECGNRSKWICEENQERKPIVKGKSGPRGNISGQEIFFT